MYRLIERRRAATRLEPDWLQRGLGVGLFALLVIGACWIHMLVSQGITS